MSACGCGVLLLLVIGGSLYFFLKQGHRNGSVYRQPRCAPVRRSTPT